MAYPSHLARGALRHALRSHPDAATVLNSKPVNSLTMAELQDALRALGLNPNAIETAARDAKAAVDHALDEHREAQQDEPQDEPEPQQDEPEPQQDETMQDDDTQAIEAEMQSIRGLIATGGFSAFDDRLRALVIEARKPAVEVRVEVPCSSNTAGALVPVSKPTGKHATWRALFEVRGALGKRETALWDSNHPSTPKINDRYLWPAETATVLTQIARGRNVMLFGPPGTGKTEFMQQLAARTGRPLALISCDNGTDAATLKGMTVPDANGGVTWQDGQLARAIKTPGCVICLDEPSTARPGALMVLQNVLANRQLFIDETGQRIDVAGGVIFGTTDNTNGTGGGSRKGFTDTNRLNTAFLDRWGVAVKINYLPANREADIIVGYTGCTLELAKLLVSAATVTRAAADNQTLSQGIGLRRLLSWAELLTDGIPAAEAFQCAVLNLASEQDVEALREQCLLAYDESNVKRALAPATPQAPDPTVANPTPAGRNAALAFPAFS
jgi:MoxR-like ATPase